ncbi:MAG: hypothetical protein KF836_02205 [Fimbriimonadaceae bacterium]|nr:hypothetical protein [Fimbriimonadaceae bacterium]
MSGVSLVKYTVVLACAAFVAPQVIQAQAKPSFTNNEKLEISAFWGQTGRHIVQLPESAENKGPYEPRQTAEGSIWMRNYYTARGDAGKMVPTANPDGQNEIHAKWDAWIEAKYTWDEWQSTISCWDQNQKYLNRTLPAPQAPNGKTPDQPGPIPADLKTLAGDPPALVAPAMPKQYTTKFDDFLFTAPDNTKVRRKFLYYRFSNGIMDVGQPMRGKTIDDLRPLFTKAGISDSELKVMAAVSLLEGGFDSINTYDTGFVSVGFIQFASLKGGAGSLGQVLLDMKQQTPDAFQNDFRRFGLDVTDQGELVALDVLNLRETVGPEANFTIINDKRLASVFVRAGRLSEPFKIAQIRTAKSQYYPAEDTLTIKVGEKTQSAKVKDIFRTEAGLATLMDRKVNTGKYGDLVSIMEGYMADYGFSDIKELAKLEYQLTRAIKWRKDYTSAEYALSKPRDLGIAMSRGGGKGRGGG